jgi:hypothetical protein
VTDMRAVGEITLTDGSTLTFAHDLAARLTPEVLETGLRTKAEGLLGAEAAILWQSVATLDQHSAADLGKLLRAA